MTRDKFIDRYMARSGLSPSLRTPEGFKVKGRVGYVALTCCCGEEMCEGWAMIRNDPDDINTHNELWGGK